MSLTPADLHRLAHSLPGAETIQLGSMSAQAYEPDGRNWRISISNQRVRKIASVQLPTADVDIELEGYSPKAAKAFIERFHLVFRRGGG